MAPSAAITRLFQQAESAHDAGRVEVALDLYRQVLARAPEHPGALFGGAMLLLQTGRAEPALPWLRRLAALAPDDPRPGFRLGQALAMLGRHQEAVPHLDRACRLAPDDVPARLALGIAQLRAGARDDAHASFQRAELLEPRLPQLGADPSLPAELREHIGIAAGELTARYLSFVDGALEHAAQVAPGESPRRLERALRAISGGEPIEPSHPRRRAPQLCFPDLPDTPWFEPEQFPWMRAIQDGHEAIRAELDGLLSRDATFTPYLDAHAGESDAGTDLSSLKGSMSWSAWHLHRNARRLEAHCVACPETARLLEAAPVPHIPGHSPEAFFSRLQPGGHIVPHYGLMNVRLTVHLALLVPPGCGIKVLDETRAWRQGEILVFDDSFEHEAWNHGDRERVVLIFEAWHPALGAAERAGVERYFAQRRAWREQFEAGS